MGGEAESGALVSPLSAKLNIVLSVWHSDLQKKLPLNLYAAPTVRSVGSIKLIFVFTFDLFISACVNGGRTTV